MDAANVRFDGNNQGLVGIYFGYSRQMKTGLELDIGFFLAYSLVMVGLGINMPMAY